MGKKDYTKKIEIAFIIAGLVLYLYAAKLYNLPGGNLLSLTGNIFGGQTMQVYTFNNQINPSAPLPGVNLRFSGYFVVPPPCGGGVCPTPIPISNLSCVTTQSGPYTIPTGQVISDVFNPGVNPVRSISNSTITGLALPTGGVTFGAVPNYVQPGQIQQFAIAGAMCQIIVPTLPNGGYSKLVLNVSQIAANGLVMKINTNGQNVFSYVNANFSQPVIIGIGANPTSLGTVSTTSLTTTIVPTTVCSFCTTTITTSTTTVYGGSSTTNPTTTVACTSNCNAGLFPISTWLIATFPQFFNGTNPIIQFLQSLGL